MTPATQVRFEAARLWPVLAGLILLIAGALAIEAWAARSGRRLVTRIGREADALVTGGDDDGGEDGAQPADAPPLDETHAQARVAARRGDFEHAFAAFARAAAAHPDAAALHAEIGYWMLHAGRPPAEALVELQRALALRPDDPLVLFNLGVAHGRVDDDASAERDLRQALAVRPAFGTARVALGSLLRRRGRVAEAIVLLEEAARAGGGNDERARTQVALGAAYLAAGRTPDAQAAFERAVNWAPAQVEIRIGVGRAWLAHGGVEGARRATAVFERAIEMAPSLPQVHSALGRAREKAGDLQGAERAYERALRADPGYRYVRRRLLRLALDRQDFTRARLEAERLLADDVNEPEHHFLAGLVAGRDGRLDDARRHYQDAIARSKGGYPEAWLNLGVLERGAHRLPEAIEAYTQALKLRPDYPAARNNLGIALASAGRSAEAEATYRRALEVDPRYAAVWRNLGDLYLDGKRYPEAIDAYRHAVESRPAYQEAQLQLGIALARGGHREEAIASYRALVATQPRYVSAWYNLAVQLDAAGRSGEAAEALKRALALDGEHVESLRKLAEIQMRDADPAARKTLEDLLDVQPGDRLGRLALAEVERRAGHLDACGHIALGLVAERSTDAEAARLVEQCRQLARPGEDPR